jgi:hypothetical protein
MARREFVRGQDTRVRLLFVTNNDLAVYDDDSVTGFTVTDIGNIEDDREFGSSAQTTIINPGGPRITSTSNGGEVRLRVEVDQNIKILSALMGNDPDTPEAFAFDPANMYELGLIASWTNPDADAVEYGVIVVPGMVTPGDLSWDNAQDKVVREFTIRSPMVTEGYQLTPVIDVFSCMTQNAAAMLGSICYFEYGTDGVSNGTTTFTSASANFTTTGHLENVAAGDVLIISAGGAGAGTYRIASVTDANTLVLTGSPASDTGQTYYVRAPNGTNDSSPVERFLFSATAQSEFRSRRLVSIIKDREILDMKNDATYTADADELYFTSTPDTERQSSSATGSMSGTPNTKLTDANATFRSNGVKPNDRILITATTDETKLVDYVESETVLHLTAAATDVGTITYSVRTGLSSVAVMYWD